MTTPNLIPSSRIVRHDDEERIMPKSGGRLDVVPLPDGGCILRVWGWTDGHRAVLTRDERRALARLLEVSR